MLRQYSKGSRRGAYRVNKAGVQTSLANNGTTHDGTGSVMPPRGVGRAMVASMVATSRVVPLNSVR